MDRHNEKATDEVSHELSPEQFTYHYMEMLVFSHSAAVMVLCFRELIWALCLTPAASKQWPWVSHLALPNLLFFICQVEESTTIYAFQVCGEDDKRCVLQELSDVQNIISVALYILLTSCSVLFNYYFLSLFWHLLLRMLKSSIFSPCKYLKKLQILFRKGISASSLAFTEPFEIFFFLQGNILLYPHKAHDSFIPLYTTVISLGISLGLQYLCAFKGWAHFKAYILQTKNGSVWKCLPNSKNLLLKIIEMYA